MGELVTGREIVLAHAGGGNAAGEVVVTNGEDRASVEAWKVFTESSSEVSSTFETLVPATMYHEE